jgi:hypothetical protein
MKKLLYGFLDLFVPPPPSAALIRSLAHVKPVAADLADPPHFPVTIPRGHLAALNPQLVH